MKFMKCTKVSGNAGLVREELEVNILYEAREMMQEPD